jgi:hypothetical protein
VEGEYKAETNFLFLTLENETDRLSRNIGATFGYTITQNNAVIFRRFIHKNS